VRERERERESQKDEKRRKEKRRHDIRSLFRENRRREGKNRLNRL
jgi:hypothetical protein